MTDRQTAKSTYWSVTAFGEDEIARLEDTEHFPTGVTKVYGGREECPETHRVHFQGCVVLDRQQRLSWFKSWLPTAHLEPARQREALIRYAMKEETAIGEKAERENPVRHHTADEMCMMIAENIAQQYKENPDKLEPKEWFWLAVRSILTEKPKLAGQLMNPSLRGFWIETRQVWINRALHEEAEMAKALSGNRDE